jgi:signal transduction histidine kinase/ActR/RegA family two-component response regulator
MLWSEPDERVIIVAPVGQDAAAMAGLLEPEGFRTEVSSGLTACCEKLSNAGVLLLTEEALELPQVSGLLEALKEQPAWSELPLIILTSGGESRLARLLDLVTAAAGNVTLLERPMSRATLLRSIQVAVSSRRRQYQVRDLLMQEQVLRREAETANRSKDEFLATVSHELRSPLNAILGWATLLTRGGLDDAIVARAVGAIEHNAKAQAQLIEDLLDVSRAISGKLQLDVKPIPLVPVIKAAVDSANPAFEAKGVQLALALDAVPLQIVGDENRLQQVFWNLLSNAVKFTPKGGRVQITVKRIGSHARVIVSDTGDGIAPEFLPHVFEPFRQADGTITKQHGGLGLGLAIVRRLVEMHGGAISVMSGGRGQGATFTVSIPIVSVRQTAPAGAIDSTTLAPSEETAIDTESPNLTGIRVLAVDDEDDTRAMVQGVLEQFGARVLTAGSAEEALAAFPGWKPDVLVFDIGMPREDGYVLIRKIRQLETTEGRNTPAIALTAYARVEDRMRSLAAGYQMFIPKPVEADELVIAIANLIGQADGKGHT